MTSIRTIVSPAVFFASLKASSKLRSSPTWATTCTATSRIACGCGRNEQLGRVIQARRVGKKPFTDTYRYAHPVPLCNTDDAVMANWLELVTADARSTLVYKNAWATSHAITDHNVAALAAAGPTCQYDVRHLSLKN